VASTGVISSAGMPTRWIAGERRDLYLACIAIIAALAGRYEVARRTLEELDVRPEQRETGAINAFVTRARGEVAMGQDIRWPLQAISAKPAAGCRN
jgi:uncharacterized protein YerC